MAIADSVAAASIGAFASFPDRIDNLSLFSQGFFFKSFIDRQLPRGVAFRRGASVTRHANVGAVEDKRVVCVDNINRPIVEDV